MLYYELKCYKYHFTGGRCITVPYPQGDRIYESAREAISWMDMHERKGNELDGFCFRLAMREDGIA